MPPPTDASQTRELVLLRLDQPFGEFLSSLLPQSTLQAVFYYPLAALAAACAVAWAVRAVVRATSADPAWRQRSGPAGRLLWQAGVAAWVGFGLCLLAVFFVNDSFPSAGNFAAEVAAGKKQQNTVLWLIFTGAVFTVGTGYAIAMYLKDSRGTRWYFAAALAAVRIGVYAILCAVFLLPAFQTYEKTEKRSRVLVVLDVSGSMHKDEDVSSGPGQKAKSRVGKVIDFLTDEKADFLGKLLEKNPVYVYRFGTRADEEPHAIAKGDPAWAAADWEAFTKYDFKPMLLKGLSPEAAEAVRNSAPWGGGAAGTPEWAAVWLTRSEDETIPQNMPDADKAVLKENRGRLDRRLEVARTIAAGTNVPDALTALVNREAANMVQGIVVFTDGRSNLASDSAYAELRTRSAREKIPLFTVAVGEDRQAASIAISDVQAPANTPPDEPFKIVVEADGQNLANTETDVFLDLFLPNRNPDTDPPDHTLTGKLTFLPGDPPHGQAEFEINPAKLPDNLTAEPKEGTGKKRELKDGPWAARARIPKHRLESAAAVDHVRDRPNIQVTRKPLRILLWASGPTREYLQLKSVLVRETQESRAELSVCLQTEAAEKGTAVQDVPPERLLPRFPTRLDLNAKGGGDPKERFNNLNEYDLIVAFDPDWSEVSAEQADALRRWVQEQGGGFVYVAGPLHTYQLARVEADSRLSPVLEILPVVPEDIIVIRARGTPRNPRRLYLHPPEGSDVLKLKDAADDPVAGWERFFTDRDKYAASADLKTELFPRRGFFSTYPVKDMQDTRRSSKVLADLVDEDDKGDKLLRPWLVSNNPSAAWRSVFVGSGELYRLMALDPPHGKEMYQRFWVQLMRYAAAKRNTKAARGRLLLGELYTAGSPIRVQARVLDPTAKPYAVGAIDPRFKVVRLSADNQPEKEFGPFPLTARPGASGFDGYYQGQLNPDPREMPAGEKRYRVVVDVPDSAGETIEAEFGLKAANPELDNTRPDTAALTAVATEFEGENGVAARITNPDAKARLARELPKDGGVTRLAFKLADRDLLALIPECMGNRENTAENRGKADDLWDRGVEVPDGAVPSWLGRPPFRVSYVLLLVVGLLSVEWMSRKLLRLA
ncbi:MAG TPA: hypothetical protein VH092_02980 [Urbifossiella sp.]|jgi:hypothetical protein|nr:hypothetical protein [Urbifossiella sp.]